MNQKSPRVREITPKKWDLNCDLKEKGEVMEKKENIIQNKHLS